MSKDAHTFGARLSAAPPVDRFALHSAEGERQAFAEYDRVLASLFDRAIRGHQIVDLTPGLRRTEGDAVALKITEDEREVLARVLAPESQQAHGGWYLPDADTAQVGVVEFARWVADEPRFSISAADAQRAAVSLDSLDAIVVWAALEPVMGLLYLPLKLRSGYWLGDRRPDQMAKDWATVDATYSVLGIDSSPLAAFKDGRSWAGLSIEAILAVRQALLEAWRSAPSDVGSRALVLLVSRLVERYYQKAKNGQAQRTKVMNKSLERALSGTFGGDWLAFVGYLGEEVHPDERITTAVEPTSLFVFGSGRTAQAATATGVSVEEIERMLVAYWGGQVDSPVAQRAGVMRDWWRSFDELHAAQAPGMPSLAGLLRHRSEDAVPTFEHTRRGFPTFPSELTAQIEQLWGTAVLPRWPQALVSEPYPHASFFETLGDGISFWHHVALTCWLICEGPYGPNDISAMSVSNDRHVKALEELGCPIDYGIFADLRAAANKLTKRPPPEGDTTEHDLGNGLNFSITFISGPAKRDGFEHLRNVVTRHRRAWAQQHLERYLQGRWEQDLRAVGDSYHRHAADRGKPPNLRQFAKLAEQAANHWFGGALDQLASALGLPTPDPQHYHRRLPTNRAAFVAGVRDLLGGQRREDMPEDMDERERERRLRLSELAERAPAAVQIWEASGARAQLKDARWAHYRLETAFGPDTEAGWKTFLNAVEDAAAV